MIIKHELKRGMSLLHAFKIFEKISKKIKVKCLCKGIKCNSRYIKENIFDCTHQKISATCKGCNKCYYCACICIK